MTRILDPCSASLAAARAGAHRGVPPAPARREPLRAGARRGAARRRRHGGHPGASIPRSSARPAPETRRRVAALYLADARLMPPNAPTIEGREAVRKFWGGLVDALTSSSSALVSDEVEGTGDLAYARGHYTLDGTPKAKGGAPMHDEGKFLEVLRRQPDGSWRYAVDMYSSDLPLPK